MRLRDIHELLAHWGLARNTYAVIGQGLVDQALSLRPEERRALFEEAAGIGLYHSQRQNALAKLEETQSNLLQRQTTSLTSWRHASPHSHAKPTAPETTMGCGQSRRQTSFMVPRFNGPRQQVVQDASCAKSSRGDMLAQRREGVHGLAAHLTELRRQGQSLRTLLAESRRRRSVLESEHTRPRTRTSRAGGNGCALRCNRAMRLPPIEWPQTKPGQRQRSGLRGRSRMWTSECRNALH